MSTDYLQGHPSLANMISTHIVSWAGIIEQAKELAKTQGKSGSEVGYYDHEIRALNDIGNACAKIESGQAITDDQHLKGHSSLAEMVDTHVIGWERFFIEVEQQAENAGAEDADYYSHEIKALREVGHACKSIMADPPKPQELTRSRDIDDSPHP